MEEVAGVLEGDAEPERPALRARAELCEQLGHVDDREVEAGVLQVRPAAGRVDDDALGACTAEAVGEATRPLVPFLAPAGMEVQRAAALLVARGEHLAALGREHARGRRVHLAEEHALDAAEQEADAGAALALGRRELGRRRARVPGRRERDERPERARERQDAPERRQPERGAQPPWVREDREDERAQQPVVGRAVVAVLDHLSRLLDQPVVLHAGRARGDAGHAPEAAVEVLDDGVRQLDRAFGKALHQPDPPARRVHLLLPERPVGRAGRQAEAAVDAVVDQGRVDAHGQMRSGSGMRAGGSTASTRKPRSATVSK